MKNQLVKLGVCMAAFAGVLVASAADKPSFVLATNGVPQAVIVVAPESPVVVKDSARMLADYLGRMANASFMVNEKSVPGFKSILVGTPYTAKNPEELCIRVKNEQTLEVTGGGLLGIRYAVQELIEHFGTVFCTQTYDYVPKHAGLALPGDFKFIDKPFMDGRSVDPLFVTTRVDPDFPIKLRLNIANINPRIRDFGGKVELRYGRSPYYRKIKGHYAYDKKGERSNTQFFCPSDEALYPKLIAAVEEDILKGHKMIALGIDDYGYQCHCAPCQKMIRVVNEEYPNGRDYPAIQNIVLANRVARQFKDKYPDVVFSILAYWDFHVAPPPTSIMLEPNVGVGLALLWRNYGRPITSCERSVLQHDNWAKLFPKDTRAGLYMWDYYANFRNFALPFPNLDTMEANFKHYKKLNVRITRPQMQFSNLGDLSDLHYWLLAKLAWNPDADFDKLVDTWLSAMYGKNARYVRSYLKVLEEARDRNFSTWIGCYHENTDHWLSALDAVKAFRYWDWTYQGAGRDFAMRRRVNLSRIAVLSMALVRYGDMEIAAKKLKYKMPSRDKIFRDWRACVNMAEAEGVSTFMAENPGFGNGISFEMFYTNLLTRPPQVTTLTNAQPSYVFTAKDMTGGVKMQKLTDADGTDFARISVKLSGEPEDIWMNRHYAEAGVTLEKKHEGLWYVFAKVRTGVTVPYDRGSAYVGIYRPSKVAPEGMLTKRGRMEIAAAPVDGRKGERAWRTVCMGKYPLCAETRIWLMNGILHPTDFADVAEFTLVDPKLFEGVAKGEPADPRSRVVAARQMKGTARKGFAIERDYLDGYEFGRIADTNRTHAITYTITKDDAGERDVFALVRINTDEAYNAKAAALELCASATNAPSVSVAVKGEHGNRGWQLIHLGRHTLTEGAVLRFAPQMKGDLKSADIRSFAFLKPEVFH